VRIAALDKRINDDSWRLLEPGRKELLLPLGSDDALRQAARRVVSMKMSQRATRDFVRETLSAGGRSRAGRGAAPRLQTQIAQFNQRLSAVLGRKRLESLLRKSKPEEKAALRAEVERLSRWVKDALAKIRSA